MAGMTDQPSIYAALAAVMDAVRHVAKRDFNQQQNFSFRGVDSVVNAVSPALRDHGVIVVPVVRTVSYEKVTTTNNKAQTACRLLVDYVFHGPDGDSITATVVGEAWDSGDKAAPKAMSVAFRTALLQALTLPTDEPDPDHTVFERSNEESAPPADPFLAAKNAVKAAWEGSHDGGWDPEAMVSDYEQWAARPIADASAAQLRDYAAHLSGAVSQPGTTETGERADAKQIQVLSIALNEAGLNDHDDAIAWLETVVHRRVDSRKELTKAEAKDAITAAKRAVKV